MRHDPASAAVVIMLRSLKMYGMSQAVIRCRRDRPASVAHFTTMRDGGTFAITIRRLGPMRSRSTRRSAPDCAVSAGKCFCIDPPFRSIRPTFRRRLITASSTFG